MQGRHPVVAGAATCVAVLSSCASSTPTVSSPPRATVTTAGPTPTSAATPTATPTSGPTPRPTLRSGTTSASCVNGWLQPAPGTDFYQQATDALEQSRGGTGYVIDAVRYFAGPLSGGGVGAIYYLDVRDRRLRARVLLVSGAGPAAIAVAKTGSTGWKPADWTAPGGGPSAVRLLPSVAGCLDGS